MPGACGCARRPGSWPPILTWTGGWMTGPAEVRLADLHRFKAWPLLTFAVLSGRLRLDADLLVCRRLGGFGRCAEEQFAGQFAELREAAGRLSWGPRHIEAVIRQGVVTVIAFTAGIVAGDMLGVWLLPPAWQRRLVGAAGLLSFLPYLVFFHLAAGLRLHPPAGAVRHVQHVLPRPGRPGARGLPRGPVRPHDGGQQRGHDDDPGARLLPGRPHRRADKPRHRGRHRRCR